MEKSESLQIGLFAPAEGARHRIKQLLEGEGLVVEVLGSAKEALSFQPALLDLEEAIREGELAQVGASCTQVFLLGLDSGPQCGLAQNFHFDAPTLEARAMQVVEFGHASQNRIMFGVTLISLVGLSPRHGPAFPRLKPFLALAVALSSAEAARLEALWKTGRVGLAGLLENLESSLNSIPGLASLAAIPGLEGQTLAPEAAGPVAMLYAVLRAELSAGPGPEPEFPLSIACAPWGGEFVLAPAGTRVLEPGSVSANLAAELGAVRETLDGGSIRLSLGWPRGSHGEAPPQEALALALVGEWGEAGDVAGVLARAGAKGLAPPAIPGILEAYAHWLSRLGQWGIDYEAYRHERDALWADWLLFRSIVEEGRAGLGPGPAQDALGAVYCRQRAILEAKLGALDRIIHPWRLPDPGARALALAREVVASWNAKAWLKPEVDLGRELELGNEASFFLVLAELLSNSARHAYPGGLAGEIRLFLRVEGSEIELVVADDGIGLPPGAVPEPYHAGGKVPEDLTGLGLVAACVTSLQGSLVFSPGPGTTATLRFPRTKPSALVPGP